MGRLFKAWERRRGWEEDVSFSTCVNSKASNFPGARLHTWSFAGPSLRAPGPETERPNHLQIFTTGQIYMNFLGWRLTNYMWLSDSWFEVQLIHPIYRLRIFIKRRTPLLRGDIRGCCSIGSSGFPDSETSIVASARHTTQTFRLYRALMVWGVKLWQHFKLVLTFSYSLMSLFNI